MKANDNTVGMGDYMKRHNFGLGEVVAIIAVLAILAALFCQPWVERAKRLSMRCVNQI
jgi:hypothetical protein